ncbi:MAG: hypothetical protein M1829_001750 [Trizodia sp. TS-e1964]|nr:MAG: hypothetical protein M1829_001750 [Trizodia sp. TS-e1964]
MDRTMSPKPSPRAAHTSSPRLADDGITPKSTPEGKRSPTSARNGVPPKIIVKKEPPSSPDLQTSRHRPRKLDLSRAPASGANMSSRPSGGQLTSRESGGGLHMMHDVGLACLSPGFATHDPTMREQLQRSISVRDQQRHIIESRLQKTAKPGDGASSASAAAADRHDEPSSRSALKTPLTSRRKAPAGLSIVPPSHEQFAHERVIQSAPLHQSFGVRQNHPLTRQVVDRPSGLSNTSHIHHVPATQTNNRLPPITDVFAAEGLGVHRGENTGTRSSFYHAASASNSSHSNTRPPFPTSPGHPPPGQPAPAAQTATDRRPREYRSAEEAVASLSGGREELLPKIIHYGGHQPPTPPSPLTGNGLTPHKPAHSDSNSRSGPPTGRRRARAEYERDNGSPPLGSRPETRRAAPFGEGRGSPESQRKKKDEFISLCARAWDLFHN